MGRLIRYKQLHTYPKKRWSMLRNMTASLFLHERIYTTDARAKALKQAVGAIFSKSLSFRKRNTDHIKGLIRVKAANHKLYADIIKRFRLSGGCIVRKTNTFTRRIGDNAKVVQVELLEK